MSKKPIKVLQFICPTGFYGAERWILALANNSNQKDLHHDLAVTYESDKQNLEIVKQFPKTGKTFSVSMSSPFDFSVISKLSNIIKNNNIDIIHTHGYKSDILGYLVAKKMRIKCVSTPHGFGTSKKYKLITYIRMGLFILKFFDKVVPLSKQLHNEILKKDIPEKKCSYIRNAVDLTEIDKYLIKKSKKKPSKNKQIGFIGQMIPRKNIKDAIDIFNQIWLKDKQIEFLLLGDGESRNELETYANTLPSANNIHFLGFRNDRMEILKDLDLFVMTSEDEGIPRCLMEACAMEIPIAAYDIPGIAQLVAHKKTGLLASFGDKHSLKQYWLELLTNQNYANNLAKASRQFVLDNFSAQRMAQEYFELFSTIISDD